MLFKSQVFTQASGSIGGQTFSHNRGGMYTRGRTIPTNPNTTAQQAVRAVLGSLSQRWVNVVTETQRQAWANYAALTPVTNRLGDELFLSGQQMYVRCNTVRVQAGVAEVDAGPVTPGNASLTTIFLGTTSNDIVIIYDNTDAWVNEDDGGMMIQTSRQLSQTINYFKGPFRFKQVELGSTASPPSPPITMASDAFGINYAAGVRGYVRTRAFLADGRISAPQISSIIVI